MVRSCTNDLTLESETNAQQSELQWATRLLGLSFSGEWQSQANDLPALMTHTHMHILWCRLYFHLHFGLSVCVLCTFVVVSDISFYQDTVSRFFFRSCWLSLFSHTNADDQIDERIQWLRQVQQGAGYAHDVYTMAAKVEGKYRHLIYALRISQYLVTLPFSFSDKQASQMRKKNEMMLNISFLH